MRHFVIDRTLRESLQYMEESFPIELCTDDYASLPEHTLNCHWHHEFEYGLVVSGEVDYFLGGGESIRLKAGEGIFVNANTMHMAKQPCNCEYAVMKVAAFSPTMFSGTMDGSVYQKYFQPVINNPFQGFRISSDTQEGEQLLKLLSQLHSLENGFNFELDCLIILCRLWKITLTYIEKDEPTLWRNRGSRKNEEYARAALFYIREHFEEDISIDELAGALHISRSECFRSFKRFVHKTPVEYLNEYRLAHAARLLMQGNDSVTDIASRSGFATPSYFCKQFKKQFGLSPAQYRKQLK